MAELIHQFGIDWRLLLAQAVNFLILFFLLHRFAYRPVLSILSERKKKIEEGIMMQEEAEQRLHEAAEEKNAILKKAEQESLQMVTRAEMVGKGKGDKIVTDALKKGEDIIREGKGRAEEEKRVAAEEFSKEAAELVRIAAAKVVERSPEAIDRNLVEEALKELGRSFAVKR
ncbi:MAG: F0F1 ATP synthase subunit B [bacterium]|nr:F0F1 ATP synthase subunit B [bacterium]